MRLRVALAVLALHTSLLSAQSTATAGRPTLRVARASEIRLDGRLDDAAWQSADSIPGLTQTEPREGAPGSARTVVKVLTTADAIVIGVSAEQPRGVNVVSYARDRDANLSNEDHIRVVFDTYLDGRSGYAFAVNANGARYDALVANQGEGENADWDGIWEAAAARTSTGWSAEIRIPLKTLLFRQGLTSWGFNVQRRIQALQETDRWASPQRQFKVTLVNRAGLIEGLPDFELGRGLSIRPSLSGGAKRPSPIDGTKGDASVSLDATQRIRANTLASLTVNTDFAETEVDTRRTNLTRFPLFFPEKRTFFLEGADIFAFGLGTGDDVRVFHSRRIGLLSGQEVPLQAGLKVNGRESGTNFGALVVRTGDADAALAAPFHTDNTMAVMRLQRNVLKQSAIGMIATLGDPLGTGSAWLAGPDLTYQTSTFRGDKNLLAGVWALGMDRDGFSGRKRAFGGKLDYPNELLDVAFTYKWLGDGFNPSLGFVPRNGVQMLSLNSAYQPRPKRPILGLHVRQIFAEFEPQLVTDLSGNWESYRIFTAPINWRLESGDRFEFNVVPVGERLSAPFEIEDGVIIPAGTYRWNRYRAEVGWAQKRKFSGQATWWFGNFYSGRLDEMVLTAQLKPSSFFIIEFNGTHNEGRLAEGHFTQEVIGTRFRFNVSPDLQLNSYAQYDNGSRRIGTNTRLRWTFAPAGALFVVYNHNMRELLDATLARRGYGFDSNQLLVKAQYAFRY